MSAITYYLCDTSNFSKEIFFLWASAASLIKSGTAHECSTLLCHIVKEDFTREWRIIELNKNQKTTETTMQSLLKFNKTWGS